MHTFSRLFPWTFSDQFSIPASAIRTSADINSIDLNPDELRSALYYCDRKHFRMITTAIIDGFSLLATKVPVECFIIEAVLFAVILYCFPAMLILFQNLKLPFMSMNIFYRDPSP